MLPFIWWKVYQWYSCVTKPSQPFEILSSPQSYSLLVECGKVCTSWGPAHVSVCPILTNLSKTSCMHAHVHYCNIIRMYTSTEYTHIHMYIHNVYTYVYTYIYTQFRDLWYSVCCVSHTTTTKLLNKTLNHDM